MLSHGFAGIGAAGVFGVGGAAHADNHVLDQFLGIQRLPGGEGRAGRFAFSALDAGVETEQLIPAERSEEHTSELQSLMRISYAVFCLKKKKNNKQTIKYISHIR